MTRRARDAFAQARAAVADTMEASTISARRSARARISLAEAAFSRNLAAAAAASTVRPRLLTLKSQGQAILDDHCAEWTAADAPFSGRGGTPESRLRYFRDCTAAAAAFQQTLDDQVATLVKAAIADERRGADGRLARAAPAERPPL